MKKNNAPISAVNSTSVLIALTTIFTAKNHNLLVYNQPISLSIIILFLNP